MELQNIAISYFAIINTLSAFICLFFIFDDITKNILHSFICSMKETYDFILTFTSA